MPGWICPLCGRRFGRARQSHECAPAMALDDYFATGPAHERPVFDAVMQCLADVGPVHVEPVSVGIFLKNPRKFAELRPVRRWVAVSFALPRPATHLTIVRKVLRTGNSYWHVANVGGPADLDQDLCALLVEAYEVAAS